MDKTKVLIVDDSPIVRKALEDILSQDPEIEIVGTASDPFFAAKKIKSTVPDVITLDIEMPRMDGLTFLRKIMSQHPIPVVIISSLTTAGSQTAVQALEYGAVEVYGKSSLNVKEDLEEASSVLIDKVKAAALTGSKVERRGPASRKPKPETDNHNELNSAFLQSSHKVIAVGASTGGTDALKKFLEGMPLDCPGIVIVQHMPELFTKSFADRLNEVCQISVKEAEDGDPVLVGQALIAPGNKHMKLGRSGSKYFVSVIDGPLVNRHRPAVDVLFESTSTFASSNALGILMTGMGKDGAKGLLRLKDNGAHTIAQDEASSIVFGMPKEAIRLGAACEVLPLSDMSERAAHYWKSVE